MQICIHAQSHNVEKRAAATKGQRSALHQYGEEQNLQQKGKCAQDYLQENKTTDRDRNESSWVLAEDGSHPLSHKNITGGCCAKSPVYKEKIINTYGHAAAIIRTPASTFRANTGRQELTKKP